MAWKTKFTSSTKTVELHSGTTPLMTLCTRWPSRRTVSTSPPAPMTRRSTCSTRTAARRSGTTPPETGCTQWPPRLTVDTSSPVPRTARSTSLTAKYHQQQRSIQSHHHQPGLMPISPSAAPPRTAMGPSWHTNGTLTLTAF